MIQCYSLKTHLSDVNTPLFVNRLKWWRCTSITLDNNTDVLTDFYSVFMHVHVQQSFVFTDFVVHEKHEVLNQMTFLPYDELPR